MPNNHIHATVEEFFQNRPDPFERPVCTKKNECKNCTYATNGFLCWHRDGTCLQDDIIKSLARKCTLPN